MFTHDAAHIDLGLVTEIPPVNPYIHFVIRLFVGCVISHFGFEGIILF